MNTVYVIVAVLVVAAGAWFFLAGTPAPVSEPVDENPISTVEPRERTPDSGTAAEVESESGLEVAEAPAADPEPEPAPAPVAEVEVEAEVEAEAEVAVPVAATPDPVTVNISGRNFAFSQSEIRVPEGAEVTINFTSTGGFHDWVVDAFGAATAQVNSGGSSSVTFTADKTGTYEYYCSVGSHRAQGMVGNLIVE